MLRLGFGLGLTSRGGTVIGLSPRSATIFEGGAQGDDILTFTRVATGSLGDVTLSNITPDDTIQMNADGVTLEYGATLIDADFVSDISATATYSVDGIDHSFLISLHVEAIGLPTGGDLSFDADVTGDETAPLLSNLTAAKNGTTGVTASVSTDTGEGDLNWVRYPAGATPPTQAQIDAGTDGDDVAAPGGLQTATVTAVGSQDLSGTGLTSGTDYRIAVYHVDLASNESAVAVSNPFTTDSGAAVATVNTQNDTTLNYTSDQAGTGFWLANDSATPLSGATIEAGGGLASGSGAVTSGTHDLSTDLTPVAAGGHYMHFTVKNGGGLYSTDSVKSFTRTASGVTISSTSPTDDATGVAITTDPTVTFSAAVTLNTGSITLRKKTGSFADEEVFDLPGDIGTSPGQVSVSGSTLTIHPTSDMANNTEYAVRWSATALLDGSGNPVNALANDTTFSWTTVAAASPLQFLGDGYVGSTSAVSTHSFSDTVRVGNTALPDVYSAGKYVVLACSTSAISACTVDGTSATEKASSASGNMVYAFEADIAGGGTGNVQITLSPSTNNIAIAVWKIPAGMTFQQAVTAASHANPTNIVMDANTSAGQCAACLRISNGTTPPDSTWTGLTEVAPDKAIPNTSPARSFSAAHTLSLAGGSPEQFRCALNSTFISAKGVLVVYG